jgi:hypothetical protein
MRVIRMSGSEGGAAQPSRPLYRSKPRDERCASRDHTQRAQRAAADLVGAVAPRAATTATLPE